MLIYLTSAVQEVLSVLRLERALTATAVRTGRPDEIYEPQKKRKEDSSDTGWSLREALQTCVMALREQTNDKVRCMKKAKQRKTPTIRREGRPKEKFVFRLKLRFIA